MMALTSRGSSEKCPEPLHFQSQFVHCPEHLFEPGVLQYNIVFIVRIHLRLPQNILSGGYFLYKGSSVLFQAKNQQKCVMFICIYILAGV